MRAHHAGTGLVEQVRLVTRGDLLPGYERTGLALRAKQYSDGRVSFYRVPPGARGSPLTAREHEVAVLAAEGLRSAEIAVKLFVSLQTVHSHLRSAYAKTGTGSRVRLANWLRGAGRP
jgi:DNA-binding CsgD family transcriptional regulator